MSVRFKRQLAAALTGTAFAVLAGFTPLAHGAQDEETGQADQVEMCVPLRQIDDSRIIDDKTIVLRVLGDPPYRRIDLTHECPGLAAAYSFSSATSISQLCRQDVLRVFRSPVASQCIIERISIIDEAEAKALLASRKQSAFKPLGEQRRIHGRRRARCAPRRASQPRPQTRPYLSAGLSAEKQELHVAALISEIRRLTEPREA